MTDASTRVRLVADLVCFPATSAPTTGLLHAIDSPSAQGARGLCRGAFHARDGRLMASVAQEGMLGVAPKSVVDPGRTP